MCIGALTASQMINKGRRRIMLIFGALAIAATTLTLFKSFWLISIGRLIHGICCGVFMTAGPKMMEETIPSHLMSSYGVYTNIYTNLGIMIVMLLGAGLNT